MEGQRYVLVVEDDPNDAFLIQRAFQQCGTRTPHVCVNVEDAIHYLEGSGKYSDREHFPIPTLLVTDLKMPGASGFDLLCWLRDRPERRVIPTIVMSSSNMPQDVKRAYCLGANAYLCKPTDVETFATIFRALLTFWDFCEVPDDKAPPCEELLEHLRA
jgi:CheY-like chemotaxis protein